MPAGANWRDCASAGAAWIRSPIQGLRNFCATTPFAPNTRNHYSAHTVLRIRVSFDSRFHRLRESGFYEIGVLQFIRLFVLRLTFPWLAEELSGGRIFRERHGLALHTQPWPFDRPAPALPA